jgi:hypothetical protein
MKKLFFVLIGASLLFTQSCKNAPEGSPSEEQSIETVDGKVLIRLKPKVGDVQKTLMTMNATSEENGGLTMNMKSKVDVEVTAQEAEVYTYNMNYKSIQMDMEARGMQIKYDSEAEKQEGMAQAIHGQMKEFIGKPMVMKMSDRGMVSELTLPGNMDAKQMGDFGSISIPLPEEPVGEGDSWTAVKPMEGMGNMNMTMTVKKITTSEVVIDTTGDMTDSKGEKVGTFTGQYSLDRDSGLTKDGTMDMDFEAAGQKMKMKLNFKPI